MQKRSTDMPIYSKSLGFHYHIAHQIIAGILLVLLLFGSILLSPLLLVFLPFLLLPFILTVGFEYDPEKKLYRDYRDFQLIKTGEWSRMPDGQFIILKRIVERESVRAYRGTSMQASGSYFQSEYEILVAETKEDAAVIFTSDLYKETKEIALALSKITGMKVLYVFRKQEKWMN
jgi:hypothetical protein